MSQSHGTTTLDEEECGRRRWDEATPEPGVVLIFSGGPLMRSHRLEQGKLVIGRGGAMALADERVSREHAEVRRERGRWIVRDLGSRNGTYVDGQQVAGDFVTEGASLVRVGHSICLLVGDLRPFDLRAGGSAAMEQREDMIVGPTLRAALDRVERAAKAGDGALITGETGAGKELAARVFHMAAAPGGPFVAVNCAAIPEGVAERLLFGAKRGAYSGADADAEGYVQAADGGTLFLDEVAELDLAVQAKLLRVVETGEVMPLGAARPRRVQVRLCAATHRDVRAEVALGRFREDLYFRIGRPEIRVPPLRERREEIPWLLQRALAGLTGEPTPHARLVERCCLLPWPGNVRELLREARRAAGEAAAAGTTVVRIEHLGLDAGAGFAQASDVAPAGRPAQRELTREEIEGALARAHGNVSAAARLLGLHRTQLYRLLDRLGLPRQA